jgi:hypothetical protein
MGKAICEADKKGPVFWLVQTSKKSGVYIPKFDLYPTDWGSLPQLGLYPRIQFRAQKFGLSPPKSGLSPNIGVIYPKVQFIPQNEGPI